MSHMAMRLGAAVNSFLDPLGIRLTRARVPTDPNLYGLNLYPEKHRPAAPLYLNLGAGGFYHQYWHNLDNPSPWYAKDQEGRVNISHDLTSKDPLPIDSNTLKVAYSSHLIEHLGDEDVRRMFREVFRCLNSGGFFRVTCPDNDLAYDAYRRGDLAFWHWDSIYGNSSIEQRLLERFASELTWNHPDPRCKKYSDSEIRAILNELPAAEAFDFFTKQIPPEVQRDHPGNHMNWFNVGKVTRMLAEAGFTEIWESRYRQSRCAQIRGSQLFDRTDPELSLYVECQKGVLSGRNID